MKKKELQKLIHYNRVRDQDNLRLELEIILEYNSDCQDLDEISLCNNLSLSTYKYLLDNGLTIKNAIESLTTIYIHTENQQEVNLKDRLIIDLIEQGLDFNYIFEEFINGNLSNIIDFVNSYEEYLLILSCNLNMRDYPIKSCY